MDYLKIYSEHGVNFTDTSSHWMMGGCPFHGDSHSSFAVHKESGNWKCFKGCGKGTYPNFYAKKFGVSLPEAYARLSLKPAKSEKVITDTSILTQVEDCHKRLLNTPGILEEVYSRRGLNEESVRTYRLGWDLERIWIPIYNDDGELINVRKYKFNAKSTQDKMVSVAGHNKPRLFPVDATWEDVVYLMAGEMDCLLARQLGINAITVTGPEGAWSHEFVTRLVGKVVYICYDIDETGKKASLDIAAEIYGRAKEVRIIKLPITEPTNGDFTNYILDYGNMAVDFMKLCESSTVYIEAEKNSIEDDPTIYKVHLQEATNEKYFFKTCEMNIIVKGKDQPPYLVPSKVSLTCKMGGGKMCAGCGIAKAGGNLEINYLRKALYRELLQLIDCTDAQQKLVARNIADTPARCKSFDYIISETVNIEAVKIIPDIADNQGSSFNPYIVGIGYYIGHGIQTNAAYSVRAVTIPNPVTQHACHIIESAEPSKSDLASFELSKEDVAALKIFQPDTAPLPRIAIARKMQEIWQDLAANIIHIYERPDLVIAIDLVYHSILSFRFNNVLVKKGRVECLILGDTRCGKTETLERLMEHYRCGEMSGGENVSYAGLVGGMEQTAKRWSITWGKIPLNDRRLFAIDEASGLSPEDISKMSGIRSAGIAEIVKIQTEKTYARTRLIWLSNPRFPRPLATYNSGVQAVQELIGRPEDIARFDFAVTVATGEVKMSIINSAHNEKVEHRYTSELCHKLIMWAWSRSPEDVEFTPEATTLILDQATAMGRKYSSAIPLVEPAEQRIKIARVAASIAARLFSTDSEAKKVIVREEHVTAAVTFMDSVYCKPSMAYDIYSKNRIIEDELGDEDGLREWVRKKSAVYIENMLEYSWICQTDIQNFSDYDRDQSAKEIGYLVRMRCLRKAKASVYQKTPQFNMFLRRVQEEFLRGTFEFNSEPVEQEAKY